MANDSSTGGPLSPAVAPAPLEGQALNRFVQQWVVGITGIAGTLVRPRWQPEPADIPDAGEAWAAIGITARPADTFPAVLHDPTGQGADDLQRHETLEVLASFYDLGTNGLADYYASLLRDGAAIAQNLESLAVQGFALVDVGAIQTVPSLLKNRWLYRVDLPFRLRRAVVRTYPVLNIESADVAVVVNDAGTGTIDITLNVT